MASRSSRSAHSGRAFSANRTVTPAKMSGATQKYPEIKQRGFYSDIIASSANDGSLGVGIQLLFESPTDKTKKIKITEEGMCL